YLQNQNYNYHTTSTLTHKTSPQLTNQHQVLPPQVDDYNHHYLQIQSELTHLNPKITHIQTHNTLPHLTHTFHIFKNKLNPQPKHWATLTYLQALL
ncbi:hypothetical protein, partial [Staphylococcus saprophyticus]|uniref:hypothetical protein n=1 Tax=Staphylococcus saprophyticus TaxID=29385 RepID=UPI001C92E40A